MSSEDVNSETVNNLNKMIKEVESCRTNVHRILSVISRVDEKSKVVRALQEYTKRASESLESLNTMASHPTLTGVLLTSSQQPQQQSEQQQQQQQTADWIDSIETQRFKTEIEARETTKKRAADALQLFDEELRKRKLTKIQTHVHQQSSQQQPMAAMSQLHTIGDIDSIISEAVKYSGIQIKKQTRIDTNHYMLSFAHPKAIFKGSIILSYTQSSAHPSKASDSTTPLVDILQISCYAFDESNQQQIPKAATITSASASSAAQQQHFSLDAVKDYLIESKYSVFQKMSDCCRGAIACYKSHPKYSTLQLQYFMRYISRFGELFTAKCQVCHRVLIRDSSTGSFLPPTHRTYLTCTPVHDQCAAALRSLDS